jgi:hypothetical protein
VGYADRSGTDKEESMKSAMGSRAAYKEAVRRWGMRGYVAKGREGVCKVGYEVCGYPVIKGKGKTWTLAFADADKRAGRKQETAP